MNGSKAQRGSHGTGSAATTGTSPVYSCFDSTTVLILGYPAETVQELRKQLEDGGGSVSTKLSARQPPHIIVCGSTLDKAFREVKKQPILASVPVVTKDWVTQCVSLNKQVAYHNYVLKPLAGTHVCITNFNQHERISIQKQVEAAAAIFTPELHKDRCTHLVCKTATGPKYRAARDWRTCHLVSVTWIEESIKLGHLAPEENHRVPLGPEDAAAAAAVAPAQQAAPCEPAVSLAPLQGPGFYSKMPSSETATTTVDSTRHQPPLQEQQQSGAQQQAAPPRVTRASMRSRGAAPASADHIAQQQEQQQQQQQPAAAEAAPLFELGNDAPMFLERVVLYWCGVPAADSTEYQELQRILHLYAGVRFPDLCDATTHIMIGNKASKAELQTVAQYLQTARRRLEVVTPQWLGLCHDEQKLVIDGRCRISTRDVMQAAGLAAGGAAAGTSTTGAAGSGALGGGVFSSVLGTGDSNAGFPGSAAGTGNVAGGVFSKSASRHGFPSAAQDQQAAPAAAAAEWVPEYWNEQASDPSKAFEDCYFTVAALTDSGEHQKALDYIRRYGGQVFTASSLKPPPRHPKVFAVCPYSLPPETEQEMMADLSFRLVHPTCRVTMQWMDSCVKMQKLVRITIRTPMFAPLRHKLPLQSFCGVRVFVTAYPMETRRTIATLVQLLGGTMCDKLARTSAATHLIVSRWGPDDANAAGNDSSAACDMTDSTVKKVQFAQRYGIQMVVAEWLAECAHEGKKLAETHFRPAGNIELLPPPTATQNMQSQLGPTQATTSTQAPTSSKQGASAMAANNKCPLPSQPHRLANTTAAATAATATAAASTGAGGARVGAVADAAVHQKGHSDAFVAGRISQEIDRLQPQQKVASNTEQEQTERPRRRLPGTSPGKHKWAPADADVGAEQQQQVKQRHQQQQDQRQQPDQQEQQRSRPGAMQHAAAKTAQAVSATEPTRAQAVVSVAAVITPAAVVAPAAVVNASGLKVGSSPLAGSEGDDVLAGVEGLINTVKTLPSRDICDASQQIAVDILTHMPEFTGRAASGVGIAATCSAGSGGSAHNLRNKRKATADGSGGRASAEPDGCMEGAGSGGVAAALSGPAGAAKRHRRSGTSIAAGGAGSMPPPARVVSRAAAGSGTNGNGSGISAGSGGASSGGAAAAGARNGSRYGTRRATAGVPADVMEMSQQVGYDAGDQPELLLAASGRRRGAAAAADEAGVKDEMLARLRNLKRAGS